MVLERSKALGFLVSSLCCLVLLVAGCSDSSESTTATPPPVPVTPKERFEKFFAVLENEMSSRGQYAPSIAVDGADVGIPTASWEDKLSYQLIPAVDGKLMKAVLSIHRKSEVTVVLPLEDTETVVDRDRPDSEALATAKEFFPELVDATASSTGKLRSSAVTTLPSEQASRFEMQYEEDRWVVLTPFDEDKQPFTSAAIKFALTRQ